MQFLIDN
jgi:hypothetical protein